jgi:hypothetical protein
MSMTTEHNCTDPHLPPSVPQCHGESPSLRCCLTHSSCYRGAHPVDHATFQPLADRWQAPHYAALERGDRVGQVPRHIGGSGLPRPLLAYGWAAPVGCYGLSAWLAQ